MDLFQSILLMLLCIIAWNLSMIYYEIEAIRKHLERGENE